MNFIVDILSISILYCNILLYYIHFTIHNLHSLEFSAEASRCHVRHYQCLAVPVELTGCDGVHFLVNGGWDNRDVSKAGMYNRDRECVFYNVIDHSLC